MAPIDETSLVPAAGAALVLEADVVKDFWKNKSPRTVRAYKDGLARVAAWAAASDITSFAADFLRGGPGRAFRLANDFQDYGTARGWSPAYVNSHLAALRSLVGFAQQAGVIQWALRVRGPKVTPLRDTRGPGFDGLVAILKAAEAQEDPWFAARDAAVVSMFATTALRLREVVTLDVGHLDVAGRRVFVLRKHRKEREWVTVPPEALAAVRAWIEVRGRTPGPLFTSGRRGRRGENCRLAASSLWLVVRQTAERAGIKAWPHGLRHAAITGVLDISAGNVRAAQRFAGHASAATTGRYDDNRQDIAGEMAGMLAKALYKAKLDK